MSTNHKYKMVAIIPARGGSKGIPRKNVRLLSGKPLISYVIDKAKRSSYIDKVVVSTDDAEITEVAKIFGADVILRPGDLAEDHVPLDPVIYHAVRAIEHRDGVRFDFILTIQPTSPLLGNETLDRMIVDMINGNYDAMISVKSENHLFWTETGHKYVPLYKERKNRQYLDPIFRETGAVVITRRDVLSENSRIGGNISLFVLSDEESVDIDSYQDWRNAESALQKRDIIFRVDGDFDIGLGHIYRALTLANRLVFDHNIIFLMDESKYLGIQKVSEYRYPIKTFSNENDLFDIINSINPNIIINDILDTSPEYMQYLKENRYFTVNFEDLGEGADYANLVINALYENSYPSKNHYYGYKYECLRDEFYIFPNNAPKSMVKKLLITFGGTDPNNLTRRSLEALEQLGPSGLTINVILGKGYRCAKELFLYISELKNRGFIIDVKENVKLMAKEMSEADIVITSNGRTIYEVACMGTPCISISQNEREARHLFVHNSHGPLYLGIEHTVTTNDISSAINKLINDYPLRKKMSEKLLKYDLKGNIQRVLNLIQTNYMEWERHEND